jgi:hypothetical protein
MIAFTWYVSENTSFSTSCQCFSILNDSNNIMITAEQIRGARAMLRWPAKQLSERSGVSLPTVQRMEGARGLLRSTVASVLKVQNALEDAGVIFIDADEEGPGVRLKNPIMDN